MWNYRVKDGRNNNKFVLSKVLLFGKLFVTVAALVGLWGIVLLLNVLLDMAI